MVLELQAIGAIDRRDGAHGLCRHLDRRDRRLRAQFRRFAQYHRQGVARVRRAPAARILPDRAGRRVRPHLRGRFRPRPVSGRAGACDPQRRRARQAILRDHGEHRHEAGRGPAGGRRVLCASDPLRRAAAGHRQFRQLRAAALRDQRARRDRARLCRRRRHRPGPDGGDSQVLLFRRQRDPGPHHRGGDDDRHLDAISAARAAFGGR